MCASNEGSSENAHLRMLVSEHSSIYLLDMHPEACFTSGTLDAVPDKYMPIIKKYNSFRLHIN